MQTVSIIVEGLVQGVFYRQSTRARALETGITGEVRNKQDGTVHIVATGKKEEIQELINWCRKGPDMAIVTNVKVEELPLKSFSGFTIVKG